MVTDTFEQLKNILLPLGLYSISKGSIVNAELAAYALGINLVKTQIEKLTNEGFVQTSQDFGLSLREEMLNITPLTTLQERRDKIISILSMVRGKWVLSEFKNAVTKTGLGINMVEDFANRKLTVNFLIAEQSTRENLSTVLCAIRPIIPAHLELRSNIAQMSFDTFDANNKSWAYLDKLSLSFDSVETA